MIPSNVDSRRPDKVQRYKPSQTNGNAPGDDLTPDYMNILGPESTTGNAEVAAEMTEEHRPVQEAENNMAAPISVIPTSSQYGIASLPPTSTASNDIASETATPPTDTLTETTAKSVGEGDNKDLHSTPSRNDRFKVVKIASLEPFRRGRWKCMDYVDQTAPVTTTAAKVTQAAGNLPLYMHTQSLPQQHFQQMLVQGAYNNPQFYQNIPSQMIPQNQYFYPTQAVPNMQTQTLPQQMGVTPSNVQPVYISTTQPYIQPNVVPNSIGFTVPGYPNVQYVPSNLIPNQGSAFIPTSQNVNNSQIPPNFQQSQTYAGQPNVSQPSVVQPMVNGHAFPQNEQQVANSLPTQAAKNAILNSQGQSVPVAPIPNNQPAQIQAVPVQAVVPNQQQYSQPNYQQMPQVPVTNVNQIPTSNPIQTTVPLTTIAATTVNLIPTSVVSGNPSIQGNPNVQSVSQMIPILQQCYDPMIPTSIYANPQFVANINSLPVEKSSENQSENTQEISNMVDVSSENVSSDDSAKANPVVPQVNAIDNKIEQAMDLVKSHLMYTVREEVEILKEKITELMEKIQQLETENNYLKTQIPKNQNLNPNGTPDPPQ